MQSSIYPSSQHHPQICYIDLDGLGTANGDLCCRTFLPSHHRQFWSNIVNISSEKHYRFNIHPFDANSIIAIFDFMMTLFHRLILFHFCSNSQKAKSSSLKITDQPIIFNDLFKYFKENNRLSPHQSGFIPGDSCV